MAAYLVAEHIITDQHKFEEYRTGVGPMIAQYGGRYLTKGGGYRTPGGSLEARTRGHHRISGHAVTGCVVRLV